MAEWKKVKLKEVLKQYRNTHGVEDKDYKQVTISQTGEVSYRGTKHGSQIGRKRQFIIDLKNHSNTLIFIRQGGYKGGIGICPKEVDGCLVMENMPMFDIVGVNPDYLIYYLKSPQFKDDINKLVPLGTAQKAVHERQLLEIEIFLPSLREQEEIVKKAKSGSQRITELNNINNKNEYYVSKLKRQILQEGVQGKLVKQDPKDESASELLKKIKSKKEKLIKDSKIRKEKLIAPISEDEIPYELPKGWEWVRLGEIAESISVGVHYAPNYRESGIPCISAKDVYDHKIDLQKCNYVTEEEYNAQKGKFMLKKNSLLVTKSGSIGRTTIFNGSYNLYAVESIGIISFNYELLNPAYIQYLIDKIFDSITYDGDFVRGLGVKHLTLTLLSSIPIPLPPLSEQKRIVEKVDKLMAYCDELEKQAKENQGDTEKLMAAVLKESFEHG